MRNKKLLSLYTFISVIAAIFIIGFIALPPTIHFVQAIFYEIQLDVNKRQAENLARILENQLKYNKNVNQVIADFQQAIIGSDAERGFVCLTDSNSTFICHPDTNLIGKSLKPMGLKFVEFSSQKEYPWDFIISRNVSVAGILKAPDNHSEIVYSQKIEGLPLLINSHENTKRIDSEVESFRKSIITYSIFVSIFVALLASFFVRRVSKRYEERIENINAQLEDRVLELDKSNIELENLNIEMNEMLRIVSHDLKSPLAGIILSIELLIKYYDKFSKDELISKLNSISKSSTHMSEIITQLLDIDFIENGRFDLNYEKFSPKQVINELITGFQAQLSSKNIELVDGIRSFSDEAAINADKNVYKELAGNLISNAIKFAPKGSKIQIGLKNEITKLIFYVCDEGPGLNDNDKAKLFTKFAKMSAKPTGGENSTGLGLYIVKKLTDLMKGEVWVESDYGKGATFYLSFGKIEN